jgi:hypothetical protein
MNTALPENRGGGALAYRKPLCAWVPDKPLRGFP